MKRTSLSFLVLLLLFLCFPFPSYASGSAQYDQYSEQVLATMETNDCNSSFADTGLVFSSKEDADAFINYFWNVYYLGQIEVSFKYQYWSDRPTEPLLFVRTYGSSEEAVTQTRTSASMIQSAADSIGHGGSELERAAAAYNYLYHASYDPTYHDNSVYTMVTQQSSACQGYAATYYALCHALGLECDMITGGGHAWNRVLIDGVWQYVDVTWDSMNQSSRYFMISENAMNADHTPEEIIH